ncbi:uncharacterized protein LOC127629698 [Xyrauchen texanus]|uniref:uncharacterized protein LOC127619672 n=1 Tax=Xyrauchen texanus TaxID=154827 RepID=UPI0022425800|nr:uncharacterized protein LOC127619672 [Xyrauchen texanus]XP_051962880.1 uncharacterized protein LOC127629698 [Xyrauchen texanus]
MHKQQNVKPGIFIRKTHQSLQTRYTQHIILHNLPQKLLLQPEPPLNLDQCQETWMKKKEERFPNTKSKFFSVPQRMPVPQKKKRRIHKDKPKSHKQSSPEPMQLPAEALPVEEEIDMLWTKPHNELVVAIVKSDDQNLEFLLHHEEFLTLKPHDWLFGETIECYLRAVLNAKGANIYQLSHYTTGVILNGPEDQVIRQGLKKMAKQEVEHFPKIPESINITPSKEEMCHIRKNVAKTILQASGSM